jgi:hypothetical protein
MVPGARLVLRDMPPCGGEGGAMTSPAEAIDAINPSDRLTIAVSEAARSGRAMPLAPADMALARPDLWATAKAAERFLEARAGKMDFGGFKATPFRVLGRSHFSSRDCIDERERDHLDLCP